MQKISKPLKSGAFHNNTKDHKFPEFISTTNLHETLSVLKGHSEIWRELEIDRESERRRWGFKRPLCFPAIKNTFKTRGGFALIFFFFRLKVKSCEITFTCFFNSHLFFLSLSFFLFEAITQK